MRLGKGLVAAVLAGAAGVTAAQAPAAATPATSPTPATSISETPATSPTPATTAAATPATPEAETPARAERPGDKPTGTVTLITGDKVVVTAAGHRVEPGAGRQASFASQYRDGHLYVYPSDAQPLVARGVLDERLFDVTQLLKWGYDDARRGDIPLITQSAQGDVPALRSARQDQKLSALGMTAVQVPKKSAAETWKGLAADGARTLTAGRTKLWLDGHRSFTLDQSVKQIHAPEAWKQGFTGEGVTVAVLDSGYDSAHPDLKGVVTQARDFTGRGDTRDSNGHGTHVASIIAGAGEKYRGVAPGAKLAIGKIGDYVMEESDILAGMEWAATEVKAKVVNMSIGGPDTPDVDPVEQAVNTLSERTGTLFVVAAGNDRLPGSVTSPGSADAALTVGAVGRDDKVADFSSKGPRATDHAIKPDVTAPGVAIVAANAGGGADDPHVAMSGTSMAAPHVTGAAAILAQRHPDWSGQRLKAALIGSADPNGSATPYEEGAGRVDVARAVSQQVTATTGNVSVSFPWNGTGERTVTKTLTYANSGDTPVTLDLAADGEVLELGSKRLEVPAKGEASVELTIRAQGKAPGDYPGVVTARSGDVVVRTLAGAYVEPESYTLTVKAVERDGGASRRTMGDLYEPKTGVWKTLAFDDRGIAKLRVPEGEWIINANLYGADHSTTAYQPVTIDGADREVTLDARQGKEITFAVDDPTAALDGRSKKITLVNGSWSAAWASFGADPHLYALPVREPGLRYFAVSTWYKKDAEPSPYRYDLVDSRTGGIPDDLSYTARTRDLTKVTATYRAPGAPAPATVLVAPRLPGLPWEAAWLEASPEMNRPATMTHYRTPGFAWASESWMGTHLVTGRSEVLGRRSVTEVWNAAVTGPAFGMPAGDRDGDWLRFDVDGLLADGRAGLTGVDDAVTGRITLARGAEKLAESDLATCQPGFTESCQLDVRLPAEAATYTLTASAQRPSALSTKVEAAWTFRSERTDKARPLPLTAVRYLPEGLDDHNRAKPGSTTVLPVSLQRNPGAPAPRVTSITVEASFDDGASWRPVRLVGSGSARMARVANPAAPGFVSLRAKVTDAAGDQVTQTITRAYAIG
ncbi:S8 family serine peptidase [Nonomuraea roseoviolacea subsp. roseoviolacea]|uniref:S8 family serine peptidase n=1 Tax=Nonomuraea roseoviolacea TaxID=103837 RepID=UPI0031DAFFCE